MRLDTRAVFSSYTLKLSLSGICSEPSCTFVKMSTETISSRESRQTRDCQKIANLYTRAWKEISSSFSNEFPPLDSDKRRRNSRLMNRWMLFSLSMTCQILISCSVIAVASPTLRWTISASRMLLLSYWRPKTERFDFDGPRPENWLPNIILRIQIDKRDLYLPRLM